MSAAVAKDVEWFVVRNSRTGLYLRTRNGANDKPILVFSRRTPLHAFTYRGARTAISRLMRRKNKLRMDDLEILPESEQKA